MTTETVTDTSLRLILAQASSPVERMAGRWVRGVPGPIADQRYARWELLVADSDPARVAAVLAARGLDPEQWRAAFGEPELVDEGTPDDWITAAEDLLEVLGTSVDPGIATPTLGEITGPGLPTGVDPDQPWRFHPGFAAWMAHAEVWLEARCPGFITESARTSLRNNLARRMLGTCGPVLMQLSESGDLFNGDVTSQWLEIWSQYPVVARLLATTWQQWHTVVGEVVDRIAADLPTLSPGAAVLDIELGAGDQHAGGRGVAVIQLADTRLFLKPRNDGVHDLLATVLENVDPHRELGLRLPEVVDRDGYVWVREVGAADCPDPAGYFFRAGALLRVLQALGATDLHHENFIAASDLPVLVDLETALATGTPGDSDPNLAMAMSDLPGPTSMVTSPVDGPPGTRSADLGALAGPDTRLTPYAVRTVTMTAHGPEVGAARLAMANGSALPTVAGRPVGLPGHEDDLVAGYLAAQERLAGSDAAALLTAQAARTRVRMVVRPTRVYARLLSNSLAPAVLTDGAERELVLERLWRAAPGAPAGLIAAEQEAMRELDVPMFTMDLDGTVLIDDREREIPDFVQTPPVAAAIDSLAAVGRRTDGAELRAAVFAGAPRPEPGLQTRDPIDPAAVLVDQVIETADGTPAWLGLDYDPTRYRWRPGRLGPGLLGDAGIGLALATVPSFQDVARRSLLAAVERGSRLDPRTIGSDAFTGVSGILYATARASTLIDGPELAAAAASLLPFAMVAARASKPTYGMDAVAGAALAALHLRPSSERDTALDELAGLLEEEPGREFDSPDFWSKAMPSAPAGRLLARHRLAELGLCPEPVPDAWTASCVGNAPGDRAAMASCGVPISTFGATNWWEALSEAEIALIAGAEAEMPPITSCLGDTQAPATWLLSAVHGTAAWLLADTGPDPRIPRVRVMK